MNQVFQTETVNMALSGPRPPQSLPLAIQVAENAMQEFIKRWLSGLQPCLLLETNHEGQIFVTSKVPAAAKAWINQANLQQIRPLFPHAQVLHRHLPRTHRDSPSRRRRRERRAKARQDQAADQTAPQDDQAAVIVAAPQFLPPPAAAETAAKNAHENDAEIDDSVSHHKPVRPVEQSQPTAAQVAPLHLVLGAAQAHPHPQQRVQVNDELCRDQDFYEYLEQQRIVKERQIRELSTKMNFGFTPKHIKKPF